MKATTSQGFDTLPLTKELVERLRKEKFVTPTPVQAAAIPQFLSNRDVVVEACTGSGKTLAYVLPTLEILLRTQSERTNSSLSVGALILSPTRELALQIERVAQPFCEAVGMNVKLLTSGGGAASRAADKASGTAKERWDLLVGTPGRLNEWSLANRHRLKTLEVLILDEADTLLGPGFHIEVQAILGRLPKQRRTGLFSATQAKEVQAMVRAGLRNPAMIAVKVLQASAAPNEEPAFQRTPTKLSNFYCMKEADEKVQFVLDLVLSKPDEKIIVFFATCASVDYFGDGIIKHLLGDRVFPMHGKMNPKRRSLSFESFAKSDNGVLTCTDVLARGIDLPDVDWIIQVDCPKEPDFFVHRVGRTARAGRRGSALLLLMPNELAYIEYLKAQKVPMEALADEFQHERSVDVAKEARQLEFEDRDVLERGTRAFVAYVAYYSEHRLSALFKITELNFLRLARAFHLLRLPKLKEFKNSKIRDMLKDFKEEPAEVIAAIKFKKDGREQKRQRLLEQGPAFNQQKREKRDGKAQQSHHNKKKGDEEDEGEFKRKRKGKQEKIYDEWDELAKEEQLFKRMKRGKMNEAEYEKALLSSGDVD